VFMKHFSNQEIADIFYELAEMTEILLPAKDRAGLFRVIAFQKAARSIEDSAQGLYEIYKVGGRRALDEIPSIGAGVAERIEQLFKFGRIKEYENLQKKIPHGVLEIMQIPGIGPKIAKILYKKLKIKNIKDLERAAKKGLIQKLPRFGITSEQNILESIESVRRRVAGKRMLIAEAEQIALPILESLKNCKDLEQFEVVGSLRRRKETIGDVDFAVVSRYPQKVISYLKSQPFVRRVVASGEARCSLILKNEIRSDIEIVTPRQWGSLLQHLTGSKEHNIHLRTIAEKKGLSLSEYGIKIISKLKTRSSKLRTFSNEKDFYNYLKMDWIPPELREDQGEIEAALKHKLPDLIELKDIRGDLHVHSRWSDGLLTISEIANEAKKRGYEYICIADHGKALGIARGLAVDRIKKQLKEIEKLNHGVIASQGRGNPYIFSGSELSILSDGSLDFSNKILAELDFVTASIHSGFRQGKQAMTKRIIKAIKNPNIDLIGHPSGRLIGMREGFEVDWVDIFKACRDFDTALEINASPHRLDLRDVLAREAVYKYNVKIAINTDAHAIHHFDYMKYGVDVARRAWLEKKNVLNTWSGEKLENWLKNKK